MKREHMISEATLSTLALMILSVLFVVMIAKESIVAQTVISIICFALAVSAMSRVHVNE